MKHFQAQAQKSLQEAASKHASKQPTKLPITLQPANQPTDQSIITGVLVLVGLVGRREAHTTLKGSQTLAKVGNFLES